MAPPPAVRIVDQRTAEERDRAFLPGMGKSWLLPLYDAFTRVIGVRALHELGAELAAVEPHQQVVDVGCGTAKLSLAVLAAYPEARVTGLDPDGAALRRAARKARRRGVGLTLFQGYADRIPAGDASLDHVISSLALHHIDAEARGAFAREAHRALRPGGRVTVVDVSVPASHAGGSAPSHDHRPGHLVRRLAHLRRSRSGPQERAGHGHGNGIVDLLVRAGFAEVGELAYAERWFGRITFVQGHRQDE